MMCVTVQIYTFRFLPWTLVLSIPALSLVYPTIFKSLFYISVCLSFLSQTKAIFKNKI